MRSASAFTATVVAITARPVAPPGRRMIGIRRFSLTIEFQTNLVTRVVFSLHDSKNPLPASRGPWKC